MPNKNNALLPFNKLTISSIAIATSALGFHPQSLAGLTFNTTSIAGNEGDTLTITLNLNVSNSSLRDVEDSCTVTGDVVVSPSSAALLDTDFTLSTTNFSIRAGVWNENGINSQPINIDLLDDNMTEGTEEFELSVTNINQNCTDHSPDEEDPSEQGQAISVGNPVMTITIDDNAENEEPEGTESTNSIQLNTKTKQVLTSTSNLSIAGTRVHTQNLSKQMRRLRNGLRGNDLSSLQVNIDGTNIGGNDLKQLFGAGAGDETLNAQWGTFLGGSIQIGEEEAENSDLDFKVHSLFWGADYKLSNNIIIGGAIGYTDSLTEIDTSKTELSGYSIAAFSSYYFNEKSYIDGIISYGRGDYDIQREISESDGMAKANTNSNEISIALNAGHYFRFDQQFIQVFGSANYITVDIDNYRETYQSGSSSGSLLIVGDQTQKSLTSNIGVEYGRTINTPIAVITPQISLDWERQYQDGTESISGRIVGSDNTFNVEDNTQDQNYFNLGLSLSGVFAGGISAYTTYEVDLEREGFDVYDLSLGVRWEL